MSDNQRISVGISPDVHEKLKDYVDQRGLKITFTVDKILDDFLSEVDKNDPPGN